MEGKGRGGGDIRNLINKQRKEGEFGGELLCVV